MAIELHAHARAPGTPLTHFWNVCVGAGRAAEGLRAGWLDQLATVHQECGFKYVRFHGLFHDDMFFYREDDDVPVYNFQYVDDLFDRLLEIGVKPFVEFGFCPGDMATERGTVFWWKGHGSPPKDYGKWAELVRRTVAHWLERYGAEEVRSWYFEVWNEPNLNPFFRGTKSQYFELYRVTAHAVKAVDAVLRVGGPATSNFVPDARFAGEKEDHSCHALVLNASELDALEWKPVWVEEFLRFCASEKLPVDFVSCHPYPTDWALDEHGTGKKLTRGAGATPTDLRTLRRTVDASAYPDAEIHLTEWSSSSSPRDFTHDYLQAATFVVMANLESIGLVDSLAYWTFTDIFEEGGAGDTPFHGGFGMINYQGIAKPTFHAYRFLAALGDEVVARGPAGVVSRRRSDGKIVALAYHYPVEMRLSVPASFDTREKADEVRGLGGSEALVLRIEGVKSRARFEIEVLSAWHGDAMAAWRGMGEPATLSREQTATLRQAARKTLVGGVEADDTGVLTVKRDLAPWSVVLVREC